MPKPFDATLKGMLEASPADWAALAGHPSAGARVIDSDVSTFTGAADKVLQIASPPALLHFEFQASRDPALPRRLCVGNALLGHRHDLPVWSIAVLLRPAANHSYLTGSYDRGWPGEAPYLRFRHGVVRVWEIPPDRLLRAGPGTLPLAPISAVSEEQLPGRIGQMRSRLRRLPAADARDQWTAAYVLLGLRHRPEQIARLFEGVIAMEESTTYQAILREGMARGVRQGREEGREEGALEELRRVLLLQGERQFKSPAGPDVVDALDSISDLSRLEQLSVQLLSAASWSDLFDLPARRPRKRRRS